MPPRPHFCLRASGQANANQTYDVSYSMPVFLHVSSVTSRAAWGVVRNYSEGACASPQLAQQELTISEATVMEFTACDYEDIPVSHRISPRRFTVRVASDPHADEPQGTSATVESSAAPGKYYAMVTVNQLGNYTVSLLLDGSAVGVDLTVRAVCPVGRVELTDGKNCGCAAGQFLEAGQCVQCEPGTFKAEASIDKCEECEPGKYVPSKGATECLSCPSSTYSGNPGAESCLECTTPLTSPGASEVCSYCVEGYYLDPTSEDITTESCLNCEREFGPGSSCPPNSFVATFEILPGFWRVSDRSTELSPCTGADANASVMASVCVGGVGFGSALCAPNHTGPLCEVCERDHHYFDKQSDPPGCAKCPSGGQFAARLAVVAVIVCMLVCLFALIGTLRHTSPLHDATRSRCARLQLWASLKIGLVDMYFKTLSLMPKLKCLVSFFQILTVLPTIYSVSMPRFYTNWMSYFNWVNLDIFSFVVPSKCITSSNVTALILKALCPLGLIAAWFFIVLLSLAYRNSRSSSPGRLGVAVAEISSPAVASSSGGSGHLAVPSTPTNPTMHLSRENISRRSVSRALSGIPRFGRTASEGSITTSWITSASMAPGSLLYSTVLSALPLSLGLLFCFFPSVSSDIFLSWSCISFQDGPNAAVEFARTDLNLKCGTAAYKELTNVASVLFVVWPVCVPLLFLSLLLSLRKHIAFHKLTPLVHATAFLHREYRSSCFWWEPLELVRKLVLTGLVTRIPESAAAGSKCPGS